MGLTIRESGHPPTSFMLPPSDGNILNALQKGNLSFTDLKCEVKNKAGKPISDRGLSNALKRLQERELVKRLPSRKYSITDRGRDFLKINEAIRSMESKPIHYSREFVPKIDVGSIMDYPRIRLNMRENLPIPIPVHVSFFGDGDVIEAMLEYAEWHHINHDRADIREFVNLVLEEIFSSLKPYLIEVIYTCCAMIGRSYGEAKIAESYGKGKLKGPSSRPRIDILNALNFDWGLIVRFEGKQVMKELERDYKSYLKVRERLVGLILINLPFFYRRGCDFIIPAMVEGGLLDEKEGEELQRLYEEIHGKYTVNFIEGKKSDVSYIAGDKPETDITPERREEAERRFLIKALEHLRKGDALRFTRKGMHGIEATGLTEDDVFNKLIEKIENPPEIPELEPS